MARLVAYLRALALALGAPGIGLIAFVDSSFLSLPEVVDLLVVTMVTRHKTLLPLYVGSATVGSILGCLVIYVIGRKGGETALARRFTPQRAERPMNALRRHGMLAVVIPALAPPPMPFKLFVFLAGVVEITPVRFVLAVAVGRGGRFLLLGLLAVRYGDRALAYMREHAVAVAWGGIALVALAAAAALLWARVRRADAR